MSVALSHHSVYSSGSDCWCSLKSYLISVSHSLCEKLARWLLQDRECFETAQRAVNLSSLHAFFSLSLPLPLPPLPPPPAPAPAPLQTQMGATVMLLARSCTLAKWISDSEMMAGWQWITDGEGFNVCNPCPSITELSFFRGDHHSSLLLFFPFPFFSFLFFFDPVKQFAGTLRFCLRAVRDCASLQASLNKIWVNSWAYIPTVCLFSVKARKIRNRPFCYTHFPI